MLVFVQDAVLLGRVVELLHDAQVEPQVSEEYPAQFPVAQVRRQYHRAPALLQRLFYVLDADELRHPSSYLRVAHALEAEEVHEEPAVPAPELVYYLPFFFLRD